MNLKTIGLLLLLAALAIGLGTWRFSSYKKQSQSISPIGTRLNFDFDGTVGGLFQRLSAASGITYTVDPSVRGRPVKGSFKDETVLQVQDFAKEQARLKYRPADASGRAIAVGSG